MGSQQDFVLIMARSLTANRPALKKRMVSFQIFIEKSDKRVKWNYVLTVIEVCMVCTGNNHEELVIILAGNNCEFLICVTSKVE